MKNNFTRMALLAGGLAVLAAGCSDQPTDPGQFMDNGLEPAAPAMVEVPAGGVDLTELDASATLDQGVVVQQNVFDGSTGTGVFESFVRLSTNQDVARGYNTSGRPLQFDENSSPQFTRDLPLASVPLEGLALDADPDDRIYRGFRADINQTAGGTYLSLDVIRVVISKSAGQTPADPAPTNFGECSTLVWEMDSATWIALNYLLAPGSGNGDMRLLIPDELFENAKAGCGSGSGGTWYVYLYSEFGGQGGIWTQDNGFEEWSVRKAVENATASKTANATYDERWTWTIDKSVVPASWDLFVGDEAESYYEVVLDATSSQENFRVTGQASLINPGVELRLGTRVDQLGFVSMGDPDGPMTVVATPTLVCDESNLRIQGGNKFLPSGQTLHCTYEYVFPGTPPAVPDGLMWANRVTFNTGTGQGTAYTFTIPFDFELSETYDDEITVTDTFDDEDPEVLGNLDAYVDDLPYTFDYTRTFACGEDDGGEEFTFGNTAEIEETGQTSSASVTVNCHELEIEKTADTSFRWDWAIDKVEDDDQIELFLMEGETGTLNYTVTASATAMDFKVTGDITVTNDTPIDAVINSIEDVITGGDDPINVTADCSDDVEFPYTLEAGESLTCTYEQELDDGTSLTNTATATQQNYSYGWDPEEEEVTSEAAGTTDYTTDGVPVVFGIGDDNCIEVWDDKTDPSNPVFLGHACAQADDDNPMGATLVDGDGNAEFTYALTVGRADGVDIYLECGDTELTNIAELRYLGEEDAFDTATWTVDVTVYCPDPQDETAWAANGDIPLQLAYNPNGGGNWATYVAYDGSMKVTTMFAGRTIEVGTATFSAAAGGEVTITVNLTGGWTFATGSIIAVQDYQDAPSGNPAPGQFNHKAPASGTQVTITVPENNFYGVHVVVMQ